MPKRPVIKNKACNSGMPKLNMACGGTCTCNCTPFLASSEYMKYSKQKKDKSYVN